MTNQRCRVCGDQLDQERAALGYGYCLKPECQAAGIQPVELASIGINKAADYYLRADEIVPPRLADPGPAGDDDPPAAAPGPPRPPRTARRTESTLDRLRREETRLDTELGSLFERFQRAEITARELNRRRQELIEGFNRKVRAENIRYRSLLRPGGGQSRSNRAS